MEANRPKKQVGCNCYSFILLLMLVFNSCVISVYSPMIHATFICSIIHTYIYTFTSLYQKSDSTIEYKTANN